MLAWPTDAWSTRSRQQEQSHQQQGHICLSAGHSDVPAALPSRPAAAATLQDGMRSASCRPQLRASVRKKEIRGGRAVPGASRAQGTAPAWFLPAAFGEKKESRTGGCKMLGRAGGAGAASPEPGVQLAACPEPFGAGKAPAQHHHCLWGLVFFPLLRKDQRRWKVRSTQLLFAGSLASLAVLACAQRAALEKQIQLHGDTAGRHRALPPQHSTTLAGMCPCSPPRRSPSQGERLQGQPRAPTAGEARRREVTATRKASFIFRLKRKTPCVSFPLAPSPSISSGPFATHHSPNRGLFPYPITWG